MVFGLRAPLLHVRCALVVQFLEISPFKAMEKERLGVSSSFYSKAQRGRAENF